jgi:hypothetical protein
MKERVSKKNSKVRTLLSKKIKTEALARLSKKIKGFSHACEKNVKRSYLQEYLSPRGTPAFSSSRPHTPTKHAPLILIFTSVAPPRFILLVVGFRIWRQPARSPRALLLHDSSPLIRPPRLSFSSSVPRRDGDGSKARR